MLGNPISDVLCFNLIMPTNRRLNGRSSEMQRINTVEYLAWSVNGRNQTGLLILDFSKAFNKLI